MSEVDSSIYIASGCVTCIDGASDGADRLHVIKAMIHAVVYIVNGTNSKLYTYIHS